MWDVNCINTPVITGASGRIAKGLKKHLEAIPRRIKKFTTQDSYTRNIAHDTEKYCILKLETLAVGITVGSRGGSTRKKRFVTRNGELKTTIMKTKTVITMTQQ